MANFTPTLGDYTELKPFRFWCQKVLPLVYDDSLSYYELLCKVVDYLNKTMEDVDTLHTDVENLHTAYEQLQEYVNDYFDNLNVQNEINNKLDAMALDGSLTSLINTLIPDVVTAWLSEHITPTTPVIDDTLSVSGAGADAKKTGDAIANQYDGVNGTYKIGDYALKDGTVYRCVVDITTPESWDSDHWVNIKLGNEVSDLKNAFVNELNGNLSYFLIKNEYIKTDGDTGPYTGWARTDYISLKGIDSITVKSSVASGYNAFYKEDKTFLSTLNVTTTETKIMIPQLAHYVAFSNIKAGMESFEATFVKTQSKDIEILEKTADDIEQEYMPFKLAQREYVGSNGEFVSAIDYARTGYLFVGDVSTIEVNSQGGSNYNAFYTNEKSFIKTFSVPSGKKEIEIPDNAFYIVMSNEYEKMLELTIRALEYRERYYNYDFVQNEYINPDNGSFQSYTGWSRTKLIPIHQFKGIRVKSSVNSPYNAFFKKDRTVLSQFNVKTDETCIAIPKGAYYVAFSNTNAGMKNFTVSFAANGIYSYPDVPKTVYSYDNNFIYSVKDEIISFDGSITGTTFRLNLPNIVLNGYNILNVETVEGDYNGEVFILLLPSATTDAYIMSVKGHITRLAHFNNDERNVAIYIPSNTTFSNLKFRVWITPDLINEPFSKQGMNAIGCSAGEYNAPEYPRIGDGHLYNVFGKNFSACKDGMLSRINAEETVTFGLLADLHYTNHADFYKRIYERLTNENIDFCFMLGDIIDSGYFSYPELCTQQMAQFRNSVQYLLSPNYPFCGNHDDDVSAFAHHGVVDYGDIRFIYFWADIDGISGGGLVEDSEINWIEEQLSQSNAKINILMCHYAISTDTGFEWYLADANQRTAVKALAEEYGVKLYLNGHEHDHNISVGTAGSMTDINLPNGQYAYCICTITNSGAFTATVYNSETDEVIKTINVSLN